MFPLRCVEHLKQVEPASVHSAFAVPRALVPRILPAYHGKVLSQDIVRKILRMSCHDVAHTRALNATSITGFLVLFCLRTGMNVDSVLNLPRGCAVPTDDGSGHWIYWEKERSQGGMLEFHEPAVWGAVEVIHRLEQMHDRPLLFSVEGIAAPLTRVGDRIGAWCEFHGLPRFRLSEIRPAMASILYEKNGGDVEDVRNYLHHANLDTTMGYVAENISRPINERLLNDAQEAMLDCWGVPKEL
jgi:integrase